MEEKKELSNLTTSEVGLLLHSEIMNGVGLPFSRNILLITVFVAGCTHVKGFARLARKLKVDDRLKLIREPKNEFDERAILVKSPEGKKLGYIPRKHNTVIASLMDAGKSVFAIVREINFDEDYGGRKVPMDYEEILIDVYMED